MRARPFLVIAALVAVGLGTGTPAPAPAASDCPVASTGRSIVRFPSGVDAARSLRDAGAGDVEPISATTAVGDLHGRRAPADAVSVSPELERHLAATDTYRSLQWGLDDIHEEQAVTKATGTGVTVAVLDSGVDAAHPDLAGQVLAGYDATVSPPTPVPVGTDGDNEGHGTFVAGLIAALRDNGIGVAGVAPGAKILPIRVSDDTETILSSAVVRGVNLAVTRGAKVINMSFGGCGAVQAEQDAIDAARAAGVLVVASSGNLADGRVNDTGVPVYPAAYRNVLAVGALARGGALAPYSVEGAFVDLSAPGGLGDGSTERDIAGLDRSQSCAQPPCYSLRAGTSFASPHVAGVAALVLSANPSLPPSEVERVLQSTAIDFGPLGRDDGYGEGRVDAAGALGLTMSRRPPARLAGADRYATAAALSANAYPSGAATVYLARGDVFSPDALAAGPAASHTGAPVLLTKPCELPSATAAEIDRLGAASVVVLGGPDAVCDAVLSAVAARPSAPQVRRVQGADRYATAAAVATDAFGSSSSTTSGTVSAYLARADVFSPDALVGGTAAGVAGAPIVLTTQCALPSSTLGALDALHVSSVTVLGGAAAVCDGIVAQLTATGRTVQRLAGADRYATAVAIGRVAAPVGGGTVALARGDVFSPDALAAAPWAVAKGVPLLLSLPCNAPPASAIDVNDRDSTGLIAVGGTAALCDSVITRYQ